MGRPVSTTWLLTAILTVSGKPRVATGSAEMLTRFSEGMLAPTCGWSHEKAIDGRLSPGGKPGWRLVRGQVLTVAPVLAVAVPQPSMEIAQLTVWLPVVAKVVVSVCWVPPGTATPSTDHR